MPEAHALLCSADEIVRNSKLPVQETCTVHRTHDGTRYADPGECRVLALDMLGNSNCCLLQLLACNGTRRSPLLSIAREESLAESPGQPSGISDGRILSDLTMIALLHALNKSM